MHRFMFSLVAAWIAAASPASSVLADDRPKQPNVVLVYTDDLGWQDIKCYDIDEPCPYDTPNLDAFAKKGVMFWQAYSPAPTCSPSRCAVISGVHPARAPSAQHQQLNDGPLVQRTHA